MRVQTRTAIGLAILLLSLPSGCRRPREITTAAVTDFEEKEFQLHRNAVLGRNLLPLSRSAHVPLLVQWGPRDAIPVLAAVLDDSDEELRRAAGQYLAVLGEPRGIQRQAECIANPGCVTDRAIALRLLGADGGAEYADLVAGEVERVLAGGVWQDGRWRLDARNQALLTASVIALARLGRPADRDRILQVVATAPDPERDSRLLEALGDVDDPRAAQLLWDAYSKMLGEADCLKAHLGVPALLALSRRNDPIAIERLKEILRGIATPVSCSPPAGDPPALCADREYAFQNLKPRDAVAFADTVFDVAARDPEDVATKEAWIALGIMHPPGFGPKLLDLALRKPRWDRVPTDYLHHAVMTTDPGLNEAFWRGRGAKAIPPRTAEKELSEMGLGRLMYPGSRYWLEWTGD